MKKIRILFADDQELVVIGLRTIIESESDLDLVGVANNFEETVLLSQKFLPDLLLLECMLQEGHCIERIPDFLSACPSCKILILTSCLNRERHLKALRHGAAGVFTLNQPIPMLIKAIHKTYSGGAWLSNELTMEILRAFNSVEPAANLLQKPLGNSLTARELTIARLAAQGMQAKKIAEKLYISEKTVRNQLVIIYSKLGVRSHIEIVLHASRLGLL